MPRNLTAKLSPSKVARWRRDITERWFQKDVAKEPVVRPGGPGPKLIETDHSGAETRRTNERQKETERGCKERGRAQGEEGGSRREERRDKRELMS